MSNRNPNHPNAVTVADLTAGMAVTFFRDDVPVNSGVVINPGATDTAKWPGGQILYRRGSLSHPNHFGHYGEGIVPEDKGRWTSGAYTLAAVQNMIQTFDSVQKRIDVGLPVRPTAHMLPRKLPKDDRSLHRQEMLARTAREDFNALTPELDGAATQGNEYELTTYPAIPVGALGSEEVVYAVPSTVAIASKIGNLLTGTITLRTETHHALGSTSMSLEPLPNVYDAAVMHGVISFAAMVREVQALANYYQQLQQAIQPVR